jgi:hypothetical protein
MPPQPNPSELYTTVPTGRLYSPIDLISDPMQALFLANFDDDPEYNGIELQTFDHPDKGQGAATIMWRCDGKVDFYITPGVQIDRDRAEVGAGVGEWIMEDYRFWLDHSPQGVNAFVDLRLKDDRPVRMHVQEQRRNPGQALTILAPAGESIAHPRFFPVFRLHDIDLVRQARTAVTLRIGEQERTPLRLPIPMPHNLSRVYFMRYCFDPLIGLLNPQYEGPLSPLEAEVPGPYQHAHMHYALEDNAGHLEIARAATRGDRHELFVTFKPALPDVAALRDGAAIQGRFGVGVDGAGGIVRGAYSVRRQGRQVHLEMQPTENWSPRGSLRAKLTLMFFPRVFRTWVKTYRWSATIELAAGDLPQMRSAWTRVGEGD